MAAAPAAANFHKGDAVSEEVVVTNPTQAEGPKCGTVVIATPCHSGKVSIEYYNSVLGSLVDLGHNKIPWRVICTVGDSLIARTRNLLVAMFMEDKSATHLMFIDDDMKFPEWSIRRLLWVDKPVVCAAYKTRKPGSDIYTISFLEGADKQIEQDPRSGVLRIKQGATGFMMIKRDVIEQLIAAHPELKFEVEKSYDQFNEWNYNLFEIGLRDGKYWGEDFSFCRYWRELGGSIWLDPSFTPGHVGNFTFEGDIKTLFNKKEKTDESV